MCQHGQIAGKDDASRASDEATQLPQAEVIAHVSLDTQLSHQQPHPLTRQIFLSPSQNGAIPLT